MNEVQVSNPQTIVEFAPAKALLGTEGTLTERRIALVRSSSAATALFLANAKGKVGQAARATISHMGGNKMVREVRSGNYRSVAEALAVTLGRSIILSNRASYESLGDRFAAELADLKDGGMKNGKPTAKRVAIESCVALVTQINAGVAELIAKEEADKQAQADEAARAATEAAQTHA